MEHPHPGSRRSRGSVHLLTDPGTPGSPSEGGGRQRWLVDGTNVVGTRPDGWWRDRPAAFARLVTRLQILASATGDEVTVVFDGRPASGLEEGEHGGVTVSWARRRGADAADDRIVELLDEWAEPGNVGVGAVTVVTSDRALAERAGERGAEVEGARTFLGRLDEVDSPTAD